MSKPVLDHMYECYQSDKKNAKRRSEEKETSAYVSSINEGIDQLIRMYHIDTERQEMLFSICLAAVFEKYLLEGKSEDRILMKVEQCFWNIKSILLSRKEENYKE